jgi:hypothetical protein
MSAALLVRHMSPRSALLPLLLPLLLPAAPHIA